MDIVVRNMAQITLPEDLKHEILSFYVHAKSGSIGDSIRTYRYKEGVAYLPPNMTKLQTVATMTGATIIDKRSYGVELTGEFVQQPSFTFRDHQVQPAQELLNFIKKEKYGILRAGCGCGKTVTMTYVAGHLGRKILIIVDMGSLLTQWQEAFNMVWGKDVQILDRATSKFSDVCITTFQLLHFNPELIMRLRREFGCLLLDEFHSTSSDTRREVLMKLNNAYRIGCTATLMKKGYSDAVLTDMVSDKWIEMKDANELKPTVVFVPTTIRFYSNNPDDWGKITSKLGKDLVRSKFIADLVADLVAQGRRILVAGVTIESLRSVMFHLNRVEGCRPTLYVGSTTLVQDKALRTDVANGSINVVLTVKKFDKGIDVPSLDCLVLARPANNQAFIQQVAGRIVRDVPGKPAPIIYDLVDNSDLAKTFAKNRARWYKNLGYRIGE